MAVPASQAGTVLCYFRATHPPLQLRFPDFLNRHACVAPRPIGQPRPSARRGGVLGRASNGTWGALFMFRQCVAVALLATAVSACGSITRGTSELIAFNSEPPGAAVQTSKNRFCPSTPCSLDIPRSEEFDATFTLPGYRPKTVPVRTKLVGTGAAGFAGNVLAGGVIGMGVDAYNGAAFDHFPNPVNVTMVPDALPSAERIRGPRRGRPGV